jgi:hypothetical protein
MKTVFRSFAALALLAVALLVTPKINAPKHEPECLPGCDRIGRECICLSLDKRP